MAKVIFGVIALLFIIGMINGEHEETLEKAKEPTAAATEPAQEPKTASTQPQEPKEPPPPPSPWRVSESRSQLDDSPAVYMTTLSKDTLSGAYGAGAGPATLHLRCLENSTNLFVKLNGHFLADIQGYGDVTYRIDDLQARTVGMKESTDNKALGLWSGGSAIPMIRRLIGHDEMLIRVTPYNQSAITVTFPIRDLEEEIKPLRSACNW